MINSSTKLKLSFDPLEGLERVLMENKAILNIFSVSWRINWRSLISKKIKYNASGHGTIHINVLFVHLLLNHSCTSLQWCFSLFPVYAVSKHISSLE